MNESLIKELESMKDDYSGPRPASTTPTKMIDFYPDIMRQNAAFCDHINLPV